MRFRTTLITALATPLIGYSAVACSADVVGVVAPTAVMSSPIFRSSSLRPDEVRPIYGPTTIVRATGTPTVTTFTLSGYGPVATLHIANGRTDGARRVTSATVTVDGREVFGPRDFGNRVGELTATVGLGATSTVRIEVAGAPGDQLTVRIDGTLATAAQVPPGGGSLALLGQQVLVEVPAGAAAATTTISAEPSDPPSGEGLPGTSITMGPAGTVFPTPITLSIAFDPTQLPQGVRVGSLRMHWWNVDRWESLPGQRLDLVRGVVSAEVSHFTEFALLADSIEFCPTDDSKESDLRTAVTRVAPGGTVLVCDGEFAVAPVLLDKPITLRSLSPHGATLLDPDTATAGQNFLADPILRIDSVSSGTVRIVDLAFRVRDVGIRARGSYSRIEIDSARFNGVPGAQSVAIRLDSSLVTNPVVEITDSEFADFTLGVWPVFRTETNVRRSRFSRFIGGQVVYSNGNTADRQSYGVTEDNLFQNCATSGCVRILTTGGVMVRRNRFEALDQTVTLGAVTIQSQVQPGAQPSVIEDNVFESQPTGAATNLPAGWRFQHAIYVADANVRTHVIRRNTISDAYAGLFVSNSEAVVSDNTVTGGFFAFRQIGTRSISIERNDFLGLVSSFSATNPNGRYRCNWWGSGEAPPPPVGSIPASTYTPWAVAPIAGETTACDPSGGFAAVRVCATPGGTGPTVGSIAPALGMVNPGGTIRFCDGTHVVQNVVLSKPVVVTAEGPGRPTLDVGAAPRGFLVSGLSSGSISITGLRFIGGTSAQVDVSGSVTAVTVADNELQPPQTNPPGSRAGILVNAQALGSLVVRDNRFTGGDIGVSLVYLPGAAVSIEGNDFSSQVRRSIEIVGSAPGSRAAAIAIVGNAFVECAPSSCMFVSQPANVIGNSFTADIARPSAAAIQILINGGNTAPFTITDNVIEGIGTVLSSRNQSTSYPWRTAGIVVQAAAVDVSRNRISGGFQGVIVGHGNQYLASTVTGTDNVIATTFTPINSASPDGPSGTLTLNWSDFTDYVLPFGSTVSFATAGVNLRCNWWGDSGGPAGLGGLPATAYTPFAVAPAALQPRSGCAP